MEEKISLAVGLPLLFPLKFKNSSCSVVIQAHPLFELIVECSQHSGENLLLDKKNKCSPGNAFSGAK